MFGWRRILGLRPDISADHGGMIAGRDINIYNVSPQDLAAITEVATNPLKQLNKELQATVADLQRQLGANQEQVLGFFRLIHEAGVAVEAIPARLPEIAARYNALLAGAAPEPGDNDETSRLKEDLRTALEKTDLERADALLAEILAVQDHELERRALEAAATWAQRGEVAMTRLRYREAADHFGAAAGRVPVGNEAERTDFLNRQALALYRQGEEFGANDALRSANDAFIALLALCPREREPFAWAGTQNNLGIALRVLGERGDDPALRRAVECYEGALEEFSRRNAPAYVAAAERNFADARALLSGK